MENSKLKRAVALVLSVLMLCGIVVMSNPATLVAAKTTATKENTSTTSEALEILGDDKWAEYKEKHSVYPNYEGEAITVGSDAITGGLDNVVIGDYEGRSNVALLSDSGAVTWTVNVPETGLYAIEWVYNYLTDERSKATDIESLFEREWKNFSK